MEEKKFVCSECGAKLTEENLHTFDGHAFCEACYDSKTVVCDNCGSRIWRENADGDSNYTLCSQCYEFSFTTCEDCGRLIHHNDAYYEDDSDYPYCRECFEKLNNNAIKRPNVTAAVIPAAVAVSPPVSAPIKPYSVTASLTPFARL